MPSLIEIIAVLLLLGILAAVAMPRYFDLSQQVPARVAVGQIAEIKGRLATALNQYILAHDGTPPADGAVLIDFANSTIADACPYTETPEGEFVFKCALGTGTEVVITVSEVQGKALIPAVTGSYQF